MKRKSNNDGQRFMMEYRMRTPYAIPTPTNSSTPPQPTTPRRHAAHEKSHSKQTPITDPSYHYENRVDKTYRTNKTTQQKKSSSSNETVPTTTAKKSSCCTIL